MGGKEGENVRLILFPLPYQSHINPMLHLAQILYSKGFSITIIHTHFNSLRPSDHPNFTFFSIHDGLSDGEIDGVDVFELTPRMNSRCVEPFRKCMAELVGAGGVGCLITDVHWHFTQGVADELGIRRIVVRTGNISSFLAMLALPALRRNGLLSSEANLEDPLPDLPELRLKDLPAVKAQSPHPFDQHLASILIQTKASSGLIFNSFHHLELHFLARCRQLFSPTPIFPLGPLHKHLQLTTLPLPPQPHPSLSWLNTKPPKSVLYVCFGTLCILDPHQFLEIAWGLANSTHPFLWVVRPRMVSASQPLPEGFEEMVGERGLIVEWAPQIEVLAHPAIGGFWTHSGWNSTIESICEGVPMLCYPGFGDQYANARTVTHVWGIGVLLGDKLERGAIENGIRKFMAERENGGLLTRIKDLKEKADCCVKEGGSAFQSLQNLVDFILKHAVDSDVCQDSSLKSVN